MHTHALRPQADTLSQGRWLHTLALGTLLSPQHLTDAEAVERGQKMAAEMKSQLPGEWFDGSSDDYDEVVECIASELAELESAALSSGPGGKKLCDELNALLTSLYDWADEKAVLII